MDAIVADSHCGSRTIGDDACRNLQRRRGDSGKPDLARLLLEQGRSMHRRELRPRLPLYTAHLGGAGLGTASVAWALHFRTILGALPWAAAALVAVPLLAAACFRECANPGKARGREHIVLASLLGYLGATLLTLVGVGAIP